MFHESLLQLCTIGRFPIENKMHIEQISLASDMRIEDMPRIYPLEVQEKLEATSKYFLKKQHFGCIKLREKRQWKNESWQ